MLDLEHLEPLDDKMPPEPDLGDVRRRVGRTQTRRRWTAITFTLVVVAATVSIAVVKTGRDNRDVHVGGTSDAVQTVSATLPNGLKAQIRVDSPTVQLGQKITARIDVRNDTNTSKTIGPGELQCALGVGPALREPGGSYPADDLQPRSNCLPVVAFPPGRTASFTTTLSTLRVTLPSASQLAKYDFVLMAVQQLHTGPNREPWTSPSIPLTIVAPNVTARLDVPDRSVEVGHSISGFVVFDNHGDTAVSAGCSTHRDYRVALAAGDVSLGSPIAPQLNPTAACQRSQLNLAPGTTRFRFTVVAKYYACTPSHSLDPAIPRCAGHLQPPSLPTGQYEIVLTSVGAIGAVAVQPVPVQVQAASS